MSKIELLDCTLRDGAYVCDANFGTKTIGGIIKNLQDAHTDIIEVGWLKDTPHKEGTSFYHVPSDLQQYLIAEKSKYSTYVAMIDYNRYDVSQLPENDGKNIDAIRVVFPHGKLDEGLALVQPIRDKGYKVYLQAANTLSYSDYDLLELARRVNEVKPVGLSIVDTFGAMYPAELTRIATLLNNNLDKDIKLGFHSHNNQQLSFGLSIQFAQDYGMYTDRDIIIDSSLCGMGRGAGNTCTELIANYLNKTAHTDYDMNIIMDAIDAYMGKFQKEFEWGYSIPYLLAGMYECHVNNVAYLKDKHAVKHKDMNIIFSSMTQEKRRQYDYGNLEAIYSDYSNKVCDDSQAIESLKAMLEDKNIVAILPGKSSHNNASDVKAYQESKNAIVIGVNAVVEDYAYDYLFFTSEKKRDYARENFKSQYDKAVKVITSNVEKAEESDFVINYNDLQKHGWKYYDNSMLMLLRLLKRLAPASLGISGFDGYKGNLNDQFSPNAYKNSQGVEDADQLQSDIEEMLADFVKSNENRFAMEFVTPSPFEKVIK